MSQLTTIVSSDGYWTAQKNADLEIHGTIPYNQEGVLIDFHAEQENGTTRVRFVNIHYPKDQYKKGQVRTFQKYLTPNHCPYCGDGKVFDKTDDLPSALQAALEKRGYKDIDPHAPTPEDGWFTRTFLKDNMSNEMAIGVVLTVGVFAGLGAVLALGIPLLTQFPPTGLQDD